MQDSKNLKKKIEVTYPEYIRQAQIKKDEYGVKFWEYQLKMTKLKLENRNKNRRKNNKWNDK